MKCVLIIIVAVAVCFSSAYASSARNQAPNRVNRRPKPKILAYPRSCCCLASTRWRARTRSRSLT